jgi:hypothetical protein
MPITNTFTNTAGGTWSVGANWSQGTPGSTSDVDFVSGTYTSTVDGGPWTIDGLNVDFSTVTLQVGADLTVTGTFGNAGDTVVQSGATLTVETFSSDTGAITVDGTMIVHDNLKPRNNTDIIANGLVVFDQNGSGNIAVSGTLEIGGNYVGSDTIEMDGGDMWLAGGTSNNATIVLANNAVDHLFFDSPNATTKNAFSGGDAGDTIGIRGVTINSDSYSGTTLTLNTSGGTFAFTNVSLAAGLMLGTAGTSTFEGNSYGTVQLQVACFASGTRLDTPDGPLAVETLREGSYVLTASGEVRPIRWIGRREFDLARHPAPERVSPILIRADALADGVPARDLFVSPDHAVLLDGALIMARQLVNGASIVPHRESRRVTYYHIELEAHDILLAENAPAESYLDTGNRGMFENSDTPFILHPDLTNDQARRVARSCAPFVDAPEFVERVWRRLAERAVVLGMKLPDEPETTEDASRA